jgi:hypothetical protein
VIVPPANTHRERDTPQRYSVVPHRSRVVAN